MLQLDQRLKQILDAIGDGIFIYNGNSTLVLCNDKACQIFGCTEHDLLGHNVAELATRSNVRELIAQGFTGRSLSDIRRTNTRIEDYASPGYMIFDSGKRMLYNGMYVRDEEGSIKYAIYTLREATDLNKVRKKIEELEGLTCFYSDQLRILSTQILGHEVVSVSETMREIYRRALKFARLDANLLITGETGTGKTCLAKYIHKMGKRANNPFLSINCANLPESLVEAELFGYVKGAFTGALHQGHRGLMASADGGSVLLDEISEMPRALQAKLLAAVDEKLIRPIGGSNSARIDVRFISATNLAADALKSNLREDLFYRLSVLRIDIPPLRLRPDDIAPIVHQTIMEYNAENGTHVMFAADVTDALRAHPLPGNIRELKNLTWRIATEGEESTSPLRISDLSEFLRADLFGCSKAVEKVSCSDSPAGMLDSERHLRKLCELHAGDVRRIADHLGIHRTSVLRKLRRYSIPYVGQRARVLDGSSQSRA